MYPRPSFCRPPPSFSFSVASCISWLASPAFPAFAAAMVADDHLHSIIVRIYIIIRGSEPQGAAIRGPGRRLIRNPLLAHDLRKLEFAPHAQRYCSRAKMIEAHNDRSPTGHPLAGQRGTEPLTLLALWASTCPQERESRVRESRVRPPFNTLQRKVLNGG